MGMKSFKWEGIGTKNLFPHTSTRESCTNAKAKYSSSVVPPDPSVHFYHWLHTYIHPFNGPFSGTTQVSRYQKGKTNLDFTEARDSEWQWHQLGNMQVCTSLQTDNLASTPPLSFYRPDALPAPNQQRQSTAMFRQKYVLTACYRIFLGK